MLSKVVKFYANKKALKFGFTGLLNTIFGEMIIITLVTSGLPIWAASPLTTYTSIWSDYWLKSTYVYNEKLSWKKMLKYHTNGLSSKAIQITTTILLSYVISYEASYFLGVVFGFAENYAVAELYTFNKQQKEMLAEPGKLKLNLGCPKYCEGYTCIDLKPSDDKVITSDATEYLEANPINKYDEIFTKNMLEHYSNPGRLLKACHNALKPGAKLTVVTDNAEFLLYYLPFWVNHTGIGAHSKREYAATKEHGHGMHFGIYTKMHMENLLTETGFIHIKTSRILFGSRIKAVAIK